MACQGRKGRFSSSVVLFGSWFHRQGTTLTQNPKGSVFEAAGAVKVERSAGHGGTWREQYLDGPRSLENNRARFCPALPARSENVFPAGVARFRPVAPPAIRVAAQGPAQYNGSVLSGWKTSAPNLPIGPTCGPRALAGRAPFSKSGFMRAVNSGSAVVALRQRCQSSSSPAVRV